MHFARPGVKRVWTDVASGVQARPPALAEVLEVAAAMDTVVVCRLDRLGRSLPDLLNLVEDLAGRGGGCAFTGRTDRHHQCDRTIGPARVGALAEFERALMHERTMAGLASARARGRVGGRPRALIGARLAHAYELAAAGTPPRDIAVILGVGRSTVIPTSAT
jgi:DNA invertase Pin-like site-specific DNA recombinase